MRARKRKFVGDQSSELRPQLAPRSEQECRWTVLTQRRGSWSASTNQASAGPGPGTWHSNGYLLVKFQGRQWLVHRLAHSLLVGPLSADQHLHKACDGTGCVRPGGGHWELSRPDAPRTRADLPRGIRHEGTDKRGLDVWRISVYRCRTLASLAGIQMPADPFVFPLFRGHRWTITPDQPTRPTKMSRSVSVFFSSLGMEFTAKSLRAFMVTTWRKARVPDDVLRGRVGHDEATPVTDRHYHYREAIADRQETDRLVSRLLYARDDGDDDPSGPDRSVISLDAARARRRLG